MASRLPTSISNLRNKFHTSTDLSFGIIDNTFSKRTRISENKANDSKYQLCVENESFLMLLPNRFLRCGGTRSRCTAAKTRSRWQTSWIQAPECFAQPYRPYLHKTPIELASQTVELVILPNHHDYPLPKYICVPAATYTWYVQVGDLRALKNIFRADWIP
jgi:hypothetical protein